MQPITPDITTREVTQKDASPLADLINQATGILQYCRAYDDKSVQFDILNETHAKPKTQEAWHSRHCTGAWQAGKLIGFVDSAIVQITEEPIAVGSVENGLLPQQSSLYDRYCALIRSLILPNEPTQATNVIRVLMEPLEERWREGQVERIDAFVPSLGYKRIQAGNGILPGEWREHFRLLTAAGYKLKQRYRAMALQIHNYVEEIYPPISLSVETHRTEHGWVSQLYHRRITLIGEISITGLDLAPEATPHTAPRSSADKLLPIAIIDSLHIDEEWRENNLEKLLLRRAINDCHHQGYQQMLMYLQQDHHAGWSLLAQHGFEELDYRGYTFRKELISKVD